MQYEENPWVQWLVLSVFQHSKPFVVMLPAGLNVIDQPQLSDWLNTN